MDRADTQVITAVELMSLSDYGYRNELVNGILFQKPFAGQRHGLITSELSCRLWEFVRRYELGRVYAAGTGFKLGSDPDTVLAPAIAYVRRERFETAKSFDGYFVGAPDLAVEFSTVNQVDDRVRDWFQHGTRQVWVVNAKKQTVTVWRSIDDPSVLTTRDVLDGSDVLPGFALAVSEIYAD